MPKVVHKRIKKYKGKVYDLQIADDNSYNVEGVKVHNSAAGCLISYCLDITQIDPIRFRLYFERFLNPNRDDPPDIDLDFSDNDLVKTLLVEHFNDNPEDNRNVALVSNYAFFQFRSVFRDVARIHGVKLKIVNELVNDVESRYESESSIVRIEYDKALQVSIKFRDFMESEEGKPIQSTMEKLLGKVRHIGKHASGVVVYDDICTEMALYAPAGRVKEIQTSATDGIYQRGISALGHIKLDILGIKTLKVIDETLKLVAKKNDKDGSYKRLRDLIDPDKIDLADENVYRNIFWKGRTVYVFQFEGQGITALTQRIKPDCFEDIVAISAMYRPGPLKSGMVNDYAKRKTDPSSITYIHDSMKDTLELTHGILIYQEQVMELAHRLGDLPLSDSDMLRKVLTKYRLSDVEALRKSKPDEYEKWISSVNGIKNKIYKGLQKRGWEVSQGKQLWKLIKNFVGYGFNRSHAVSYSMITYQTAFLKNYYPLEFFCSALNYATFEDYSKIIKEAWLFEIEVQKPSITRSGIKFTIQDDKIVFGLACIKGVGEKAAGEVVKNRPYKTIDDFFGCGKVNWRLLNSKVIEALAESDIFNEFDYKIHEVCGGYWNWKERGGKITVEDDDTIIDIEMEDSFFRYVEGCETMGLEDPEKQKKINDIKQNPVSYMIRKQRELLGYVFDNVFLKTFGESSLNAVYKVYNINSNLKMVSDKCYRVLFLVNKINFRKQKNGEPMAFVDVVLSDLQNISFTVFSSCYKIMFGSDEERITSDYKKIKVVSQPKVKEGCFYYADVKVNLWNDRYSLLFNQNKSGAAVTQIDPNFDYSKEP